MNIDQLKTACQNFYERTVSKIINGKEMYATEYKTGLSRQLRLHHLGYFNSEQEALEALYNYLKANQRV
jgi:hypothetical protein